MSWKVEQCEPLVTGRFVITAPGSSEAGAYILTQNTP